MKTITIRQYNSPWFPIAVSWKSDSTTTCGNVFETKERAINWARGRFGNVKIIDKTRGDQNETEQIA